MTPEGRKILEIVASGVPTVMREMMLRALGPVEQRQAQTDVRLAQLEARLLELEATIAASTVMTVKNEAVRR